MFAVIRLRGTVKAKEKIVDTLKLLRLNRKMHCVLLQDSESFKGMLQKAKDYITWGTISDDILLKLVSKRGRKTGNKKLDASKVNEVVASIKLTGKVQNTISPVFRLNPPSKGFKHSIKQHFPIGELGFRGEKINDLLERMI